MAAQVDGGTGAPLPSNTAPVDPAPVAAGSGAPAVPVVPAVHQVWQVCSIELRGTAEWPILNATEFLSGMPLPGHLQPLRYPLQRLPRVYVTMFTPLQGTVVPGAAPIASFCAVALSVSPLAAGAPDTTVLACLRE